MGTGAFPLGYNSPVLQLTSALHYVPRMSGAVPLFPQYSFMTWTVTTLLFIVSVSSVLNIMWQSAFALCGNRTPADSWSDVSTSVRLSILECEPLAAQVKLNGRE